MLREEGFAGVAGAKLSARCREYLFSSLLLTHTVLLGLPAMTSVLYPVGGAEGVGGVHRNLPVALGPPRFVLNGQLATVRLTQSVQQHPTPTAHRPREGARARGVVLVRAASAEGRDPPERQEEPGQRPEASALGPFAGLLSPLHKQIIGWIVALVLGGIAIFLGVAAASKVRRRAILPRIVCVAEGVLSTSSFKSQCQVRLLPSVACAGICILCELEHPTE